MATDITTMSKEELLKTCIELNTLYYELLYAVGNKYEGETRHQTAKRYIEQAETSQLGVINDGSI